MVSYSNVDDTLEAYKIKSAIPFKIFSTLDDFLSTSKKQVFRKNFIPLCNNNSNVWARSMHPTRGVHPELQLLYYAVKYNFSTGSTKIPPSIYWNLWPYSHILSYVVLLPHGNISFQGILLNHIKKILLWIQFWRTSKAMRFENCRTLFGYH